MISSTTKVILAHVIFAIATRSLGFGADPAAALSPADSPRKEDGSAGMPLTTGASMKLGNATAVIKTLETLPFVESEYSRRFRFDTFGNPKLAELWKRYRLDDVVAAGRDEFERQVLLMDWTHHRFQKFGRPSAKCRGALEILQAIEDGHTFFCQQYAEVLVSAAASLGWVDRPLALRRHQGGAKVGGSTEHSVTEIWSNQHRKWVMLDPTSNLYVEKDGVPLNAYEIREEWFRHEGTNLAFVVGKERKKYRKADLPIFLKKFEGFGDLAFHPDEPDKYGFIGYIPNTDLMDSGYDYGKMFIVQDEFCAGTSWHRRTIPTHPATDPYFPIGQAALELQPAAGSIRVKIKTLTPNFARFETRADGGSWSTAGDDHPWAVHPGVNRLEARTVNRFGVHGPISTAEIEVR